MTQGAGTGGGRRGPILGSGSHDEQVAALESELERERACLRVFALAGSTLAAATAVEADLQMLLDLAVPTLADWCILDRVDGDGAYRDTVHAVDETRLDPVLAELRRRYPPRADGGAPTRQVLATREPLLLLRTSARDLRDRLEDDGHVALVERLGLASLVTVPLIAGEEAVGALSFGMGASGRTFHPGDVALLLEFGNLVATAIHAADLRLQARERLRATRVIDQLSEGVVAVDGSGIVRLWNPAAAKLTGVGREAAVGRPLELLLPAWSSEVGGRSGDAATRILLPHGLDEAGHERWLAVSGDQGPDGSVYTLRDVTAERALERTRGEMVATVSHQLRTPLASIYAAAVTLTSGELELDESVRSELLGMIVEQAQLLEALASDILLAEQLDAGRAVVRTSPSDIRAVVESVVEAVRLPLDGGHAIRVDVPGEPVVAQVDVHSFVQVVSNILDNAVKYSPDGGTVQVSLGTAGRCAVLQVSDEGVGLEPHERPRIFERFYRADPDMRRGVGGTGLGLYVVRELLQLMEGSVEAVPRERGTTFVVRVPLAEAAGEG